VIFGPRSCARLPLLIIPSAVDPPVRGAGQAAVVKVERPAGRTTLTTAAWSARLAPGRRQAGDQAPHLGHLPARGARAAFADHPGAGAPPPEAL